MLYAYQCSEGHRQVLMRKIAERNDPVYCVELHVNPELDAAPMARQWTAPAVHFHGIGFTRTPAILKDPIARGVNQQQGDVNWGTADAADYGAGADDGD